MELSGDYWVFEQSHDLLDKELSDSDDILTVFRRLIRISIT